MSDEYKFIIVWQDLKTGEWVSSRRPMITGVNEPYLQMQHICDLNCSLSVSKKHWGKSLTFYLVAVPKSMKYLEWASLLREQFSKCGFKPTGIDSPFICIDELQYKTEDKLSDKRWTLNSMDYSFGFYQKIIKDTISDEDEIYLDTPSIAYRQDVLENKIISAVEV